MRFLKKDYPPYQFAILRILLGAYMLVYFLRLLPYGAELFLHKGIASGGPNPILGVIPNVLDYINTPAGISYFFGLGAILSMGVISGAGRRVCALLIWYGWAAMFNQNPLTADPSISFVGLLLLGLAIIPTGEPLAIKLRSKQNKPAWYMPGALYWGMWVVFGLTFSITGIAKLSSASWKTGEAVRLFLESPISFKWWLTDLLKLSPNIFLRLQTWLVLYTHLLALPLILFSKTRKWLWAITVLIFASSLFVLQLTEVLLGMLLYLVFLFDKSWIKRDP